MVPLVDRVLGTKAVTLDKKQLIREAAEGDLEKFIRLVHPQRVLGSVHTEVIRWMQNPEGSTHKLLLLPRDHMKSALAAYYATHAIVRDPTIRILLLSSTATLATKQLGFIKQILTSDVCRMYWPDLAPESRLSEVKWTESEIEVPHPARKKEAVRDPTVFCAGLSTSITGLHCDLTIFDDVVVRENAYSEEGREKVRSAYSLLSSVESADARQLAVGTRYHPKDLYNDMIQMNIETYDQYGNVTASKALYDVFERKVESAGDGTGEYLWPRQQRSDGKWFGFNAEILAKKRTTYLDQTQFRAQYYNDPNDPDREAIPRTTFQYYDRKLLNLRDQWWYFKDRRLNVYAAIDFAFSLRKTADFTTIVVVGVDSDRNYYVLDIDRFRSDKISEYFQRILVMYNRWQFRKIRAEVTSAQEVIVNDLKQNYIVPHGLALSVEAHKPTRHDGSKAQRIQAVLEPRYANMQMWHYQGGLCQSLEEELVSHNPPHDDIKDALASVVEVAVAPANLANPARSAVRGNTVSYFDPATGSMRHKNVGSSFSTVTNRFGGIN